ncbi:MAG: hypothetical protein AAFU65_08905 [Pseudomonadota bacterium]
MPGTEKGFHRMVHELTFVRGVSVCANGRAAVRNGAGVRSTSRAGLATLVVTAAALLAGCSGEDGDQIGVATGQSPDPVVIDIPIAYVKRPLPVDDGGAIVVDDARFNITFNPGADLFVRERAGPSAEEINDR